MTPLTDRFGYIHPEQLAVYARNDWPNINDMPSLTGFEPQTDTEIPFLYVPGMSAQELWNMIPIPEYGKKICHPSINMEALNGDAAERGYEEGVPTWAAIDLVRGFEQPTNNFQGEDVATACEVFAAMIMIERHRLEAHHWWPNQAATQLLGRYRLDDPYNPRSGHKTAPHLFGSGSNLVLGLERADFEIGYAATASVRRW